MHDLRRDLEDRVQERTRQLSDANERLRDLDQLKTRFFANVSHELRTPLTLILTPLQSLQSGFSGQSLGQLKPHLRRMETNALRLYRLIDNLLDFSRLEAGAMQAQVEDLDLERQVREILASIRSWLERHKLWLECRLPGRAAWVRGDREKVEKIVLNLLSNAIKFSPQGGHITVQLEVTEETVRFSVTDEGPGIAPGQQERIFERFGQSDSAGQTAYKGTGIGLALAQELAQLQGGTLEVDSQVGRGSTFSAGAPPLGARF